MSASPNLVGGDTNATWDIFVRDRQMNTTERVSVDSAGLQANGRSGSYGISISPDGRYVAFDTEATNLVAGDTNGAHDIILYDRQTGTPERINIATGGAQANDQSLYPSISSDGRYIAFTSRASNLVGGDTNANWDGFVRDRQTRTTERVSVSTGGAEGNAESYTAVISADGRYVAFESLATNLVPGDTNGTRDVFLRDRLLGTTERVSVSSNGSQGNALSYYPSISDDGRYVAFTSSATNLVSGDTNGVVDAFLHDRQSGTTIRLSVGPGGVEGNYDSGGAAISGDGRFVAFVTNATNLILGGPTSTTDIIVRDLLHGINELASVTTGGTEANGGSGSAAISSDGRFVAFSSDATSLVPGDTNARTDVFIHDRYATGFTSLCYPGVDGVSACPCSNPPSSAGHGCDNSSATGGATLSASGIAYLSMDSLVFTANGEMPTAFSILLQGKAFIPGGVVYGQGVRCLGAPLKRLFAKTAVSGSITAPDLGAGDPTISTRSAALGDGILPGQSRWYLVYYRDLVVLGGCPVSSTFNATQTGQVTWWP